MASSFSSVLALIVVGFVLLIVARRSDKLGLHLDLSCAESFHIDAVCAALTDALYGGRGDYTGRTVLRNTFTRHGVAEDCSPLHDPKVMEKAFNEACHLNWQQVHGSATFILCFDLGYVDHVRMAFQTFGAKLKSITHFTLLVFAFSAITFFTAFWGHPSLMWLLAASVTLFAATYFATYKKEMPTLNNRRSLSFLSIVPALHIMLVIAYQMEANPLTLATVAIQALIFAHAIWVRNSSGWLFLALLLLIAVMAILHALDAPDIKHWFGQGIWAAPLWLGVVNVFLFFKRRKIHPSYRGDAAMINYPKWHSAYIGLQLDQETFNANRLPSQVHPGVDANSDEAGYHVVETDPHFTATEQSELLNYPYSYQTINLGWRLYERAIKQAFFNYVRAHWNTIPKLYLVTKPKFYLFYHKVFFGQVFSFLKQTPALALALIAATLGVAAHAALGEQPPLPMGLVIGALLICSPLPMIWAHSSPLGMRDQVWVSLISLWIFLICFPLYFALQTMGF